MIKIKEKLNDDIKEFCKLNGLKMGEYVNGLLEKAFIEDKYGKVPFIRQMKAEESKPVEPSSEIGNKPSVEEVKEIRNSISVDTVKTDDVIEDKITAVLEADGKKAVRSRKRRL